MSSARIKLEAQKQLDKQLENAEEKGLKWFKEAKRMSARPGDNTSNSFTLPSHVDRNLTTEDSAEEIVEYFAKISQEFTAIEEDTLPQSLIEKLEDIHCEHPEIVEHDIFENMKKAKKTDSIPGDIPKAVLKEFLPELATPFTAILKEAVASHTWPSNWKKEFHLPIQKIPSPQSEDDLRGIGLTSWISKQLERLVLNWIWPYVKPHLDRDQMGGVPGCSVEHYIVNMVDFILKSMDGDTDATLLSVAVDYSKAFNRMKHSNILCSLSAINVPKCAIKLIKSYLTQRTMCIRYNGAVSE